MNVCIFVSFRFRKSNRGRFRYRIKQLLCMGANETNGVWKKKHLYRLRARVKMMERSSDAKKGDRHDTKRRSSKKTARQRIGNEINVIIINCCRCLRCSFSTLFVPCFISFYFQFLFVPLVRFVLCSRFVCLFRDVSWHFAHDFFSVVFSFAIVTACMYLCAAHSRYVAIYMQTKSYSMLMCLFGFRLLGSFATF